MCIFLLVWHLIGVVPYIFVTYLFAFENVQALPLLYSASIIILDTQVAMPCHATTLT